MEKEIKVVIFEDNYLLRDGYYQLINGMPGFSCVGAYDDASDLLFKIKRSEPEVVLMDIDMPGMNGIEAVRIIKENFPNLHIIMQTVFEDDDKIFRAIQAGAEGYILKKIPPTKILDAIFEVYNGGAPMTPAIASKILRLFRSGIKPVPEKKSNLSERQTEILESIVNGMSYKLIAEKLFISVETVRYHVKNIYEILQVHSRFELINKQRR
ncbi:MAG TPA: response regulator transcription factor [Hanamia sp.]|jgi:DNA-binding NarL/FixJ family response regulator|nr:response regulator transcription factor [Hanamia sp.]